MRAVTRIILLMIIMATEKIGERGEEEEALL